jgi:electron transfer flavoprotein alpha subunit
MAVLVIADHDNNHVRDTTNKTVTAALALSSDVDVLVAGKGADAAAAQAAKIAGVRKVLQAESDELNEGMAEAFQALIVPLMANYDAVLTPATAQGKNIAPRIAAALDVSQISEIIEVVDGSTFVRPIYAGNALETVKSSDAKKVITVRAASFDPVAAEGGSAPIEAVSLPDLPSVSRFVSAELSKSERPELTAARVVISGGRGMQAGDNFKLLEPIADSLGAAVGASRAAVDAGFVPNDYQVGQTGKIVAPDLYIAVGISGAIQHLAGMKDSKVIVAINKDEEAPIFQVADYGLVADLFAVLPELAKELERS